MIFTKLDFEKQISVKEIAKQEPCAPIGRVWMSDTLAGYLRGPTGILIGSVRAKIQHLDVLAPKELGGDQENRKVYGDCCYGKWMF